MTAPAGKRIHETFQLFDVRPIANSKTDIFPRPQPSMSNVFPLRRRVTAMAVAAITTLNIMNRMAGKTELTRLCPKGWHCSHQQGNNQKISDQFPPRKNIATTVNSTIATATKSVIAVTVRCSRGNQLAQ